MDIVFTFLGGLGLLIYGMGEMNKGLQRLAGNRLKGFLRTLTQNRFIGVLSGAIATGIIQSSSVITVITVGFVNAGLMALPQAISVILGAHIGTTITAQIIAFRIDSIAFPMIAVGAFMHLLARSDTLKHIGCAVFGFGALFFGLQLMTTAFDPLRNNPAFQTLFANLALHPFVAFLVGLGITVLVRESSVTTGITIALALSSVITFEQAVPLILGENIGTTVTANIAAIGGSHVAKQAARAHFIINAIGATLAFILLRPFMRFVLLLSPADDVARQIANAHTIFNVLNTLFFLPFIAVVAQLTDFLIFGKKPQEDLYYLEETSLGDPGTALDQAQMALKETNSYALELLKLLARGVVLSSEKDVSTMKKFGEKIVRYQSRITEYLEKIASQNPSKAHLSLLPRYVRIIHEIERTHDYEEKMRDVLARMIAEGRTFHPIEKRELKNYFADVIALVVKTNSLLAGQEKKKAVKIMEEHDVIYATRDALRNKSRKRFEARSAEIATVNYYYDIITALEEIAKKCRNIAKAVIE